MKFEDAYLSHRALIETTAAQVCRRNRTRASDIDDFTSMVHLHLMANDFAVFRAFEGRGALGAYLQAVIRRLFQDWRNANWGRWRPSASVRRQGPVAILLETLLVRDNLPLDQAIEVMRTNHGVTESPSELESLAAGFPRRTVRTFTSDEGLEATAEESSHADALESTTSAAKVSLALEHAMANLSCQDRLILRMRFDDDVPVSSISRVLGLQQPQLYRHVNRLLRGLKTALEEAGIGEDDARTVIASRGFVLLEERTGDREGRQS